jgi:hypothetical protein
MSKDTTAVATIDPGTIMEAVIAKGNLRELSPEQRAKYYTATCESMGLNPLTKPFDYIDLNGKLTLYATRTATDQLRRINGVSVTAIERDTVDGIHIVTVRVRDNEGREDEEIGAVSLDNLAGEKLANAYMKAVTKAKRRATLSISGLGWLDETEVDTIPDARRVPVSSYVPDDEPTIDIAEAEYQVDGETGEITDDDSDFDEDVAHDNIPQMSEVEEEYLAAILGAESKPRLIVIGEEMRGAGVGNDELRAAYSARLKELSTPRTRQPQLVGATSGEAGQDKFTG